MMNLLVTNYNVYINPFLLFYNNVTTIYLYIVISYKNKYFHKYIKLYKLYLCFPLLSTEYFAMHCFKHFLKINVEKEIRY